MALPRRRSWTAQLERDRAALQGDIRSGRERERLADAAPRLADSVHRPQLAVVLARLPRDEVARDPRLGFAEARTRSVLDDTAGALTALTRAQAALERRQPQLRARIAFELGALHMLQGEIAAAQAVLEAGTAVVRRRDDGAADLAHLRALIEEMTGHRQEALRWYAEAVSGSSRSLSPLTRVLALRNRAGALAHEEPSASVGLYGLALAVIEAEQLDRSQRPTVANMMGYALICTGDLDGAECKLAQAGHDAAALERPRIARFARFNLSIAAELRGRSEDAERSLEGLRMESAAEMPELARWCALRLAWLAFRRGGHDVARSRLDDAFPGAVPVTQRESLQLLRALIAAATGRATDARRTLSALAETYRERGDLLTPFALDLWRAHFEHLAGRPRAAERAVAEALSTARAHGFRLAPNWWAPELAAVARRYARGEDAEHALRLISPAGPTLSAASQDVAVTSEGDVLVDGKPLDAAHWRVGRTGSGVLRRYFNALAAAHPAGLSRDELADLLWPDSEGDKAVRNLYAATDDLRRVLAGVPGLGLTVVDQRYRLQTGERVRFQ